MISLISRIRILDIKKSNSWYKKMHILISRIRFLDIKKWNTFIDNKKSNSLYQEIISWYQEIDFLIWREMYSEALFYYLLCISWYQEFDFLISRIPFLISQNKFLDIKKWNIFLDIKKSNSWNHEINFLISKYRFLDIKNSIPWYQVFDFYISRIWFLDIKK